MNDRSLFLRYGHLEPPIVDSAPFQPTLEYVKATSGQSRLTQDWYFEEEYPKWGTYVNLWSFSKQTWIFPLPNLVTASRKDPT